MRRLSGIPINVSLEFLNSTIETGLGNDVKYKADYNKAIGEIADINLPKNTTHTVNDWFTIELVDDNGIKASKILPKKEREKREAAKPPVESQSPREAVSTPEKGSMTLEQVEEWAKKNKVLGRQTKDAWAAIPDNLKLKLLNEGARLQLSYGNKNVTVAANNLRMLTKALTEANMAALGGSLKVSEAAKASEKDSVAFSREREREARRWLSKNLPSLSSEERTQFVDKILRMGDNAGKYWGSYKAGVIEIQRNAPMGTAYHEAFHYVMDMLLSDEEKQNILNIAREEYGVNDDWTAEERLANDFRRYALDENAQGIVGRIKRWIRQLRDKIMRYNRISDATINQLFWKINNGEFAQKATEVESFEDTQQKVLKEIRNVQIEKVSWKNLSRETKKNFKDSGLSEEAYEQMSLEEKEQYIKCRG